MLADLVRIQYGRNDVAFEQGTFRVRGDSVEIFPAYAEQAIRIEFWGDEVERISKINPLTGDTIAQLDQCAIYPAKHFVTERAKIERAVTAHPRRAGRAAAELRSAGKLLEAQRLESRTGFDVEMLLEVGTCAGIENYSRHLSGRRPGERPACLFDYFPADTWSWWTSRTSRSRRSAGCSTATGRESSPWSSTASVCPPRWTTGRCSSTSS